VNETDVAVVRARDTDVFLEGSEAVRMYFRTAKLTFSIGALPPGHKTPMDPGHPGSLEVAFVLEGEAIFEFPDPPRTEWLQPGDAILVPEGAPHLVHNPTAGVTRVAWALAPGLTHE
jgi:mannose-6-phosphate isomerase-like protein (cupin superfamily)